MKKKLFLVALIAVIVLFAGCPEEEAPEEQNGGEENTKPQLVECGADRDCFNENLETCTPAMFETGLGDQIRFEFTIKGIKGENCEIHHLATKSPMPEIEGTYYDCLAPREGLNADSYEAWLQANMMTSCTGTFLDAVNPECYGVSLRVGGSFSSDRTDGKMFTLLELGTHSTITVDVDGVTDTIEYLETKTVNGISIKNNGPDGEMVEMEFGCD